MEPLPIILAALILASTDFMGILLPVKNYVSRKWWLSFSGGVAVVYVFIHLIPELNKITPSIRDPLTFSIVAVGTITYFGVAKFVKNSKQTSNSRTAFFLQMITLIPYFFTIGYFLEHFSTLIALASYTIAAGLHLVAFGYDLKEDHKENYTHLVAFALSAVLLVGTATSFFYKLNELTLGVLLAFVTGGILLNSIKEEIPPENKSAFLPFVGGAFSIGILLLSGT
ncbi:hypothetical protein [Methanolobus sp.]|uniref:hypothetical protein n=1 Tax=Methanolobus sp. TaxID=1874737 RepID=UPI0025D7139B|nr:hypothetical protein [Methanolobus sp.]